MSDSLQDRVVLITGGARGMGAATARAFVAAGARVAITDRLLDEGRALAAELGERGLFLAHDVTDEAAWRSVLALVLQRFDRLDVLVNNAGVLQSGELLAMTRAEFERVLQVNLVGPWLGIKTAGPVMAAAGRGAIINIASAAALVGMSGIGGYVASKWGLRGLTRTAAMELGPKGVRVNGIYPGGIDTPMANPSGAPAEEINKDYAKQPIPRIGRPEEVANTCVFLASDRASYLCGAEIAVDGGMTAGVWL